MARTLEYRRTALMAGAMVAAGFLATPGQSLAAARFVCRALPTQTCHFTVLRESGARTDFTLAHGQARTLDDATPGRDRYMVTINALPPTDPAACSRTSANPRRSTWCKLSTVGENPND